MCTFFLLIFFSTITMFEEFKNKIRMLLLLCLWRPIIYTWDIDLSRNVLLGGLSKRNQPVFMLGYPSFEVNYGNSKRVGRRTRFGLILALIVYHFWRQNISATGGAKLKWNWINNFEWTLVRNFQKIYLFKGLT